MSHAERAVRVVTWNIHGGVGGDRRCDLDRVLRVVRGLDPDILALQEVDGRSWLGRPAGAFRRIEAMLGPFAAEAVMVGRGETAYGHLLWSRWPLETARLHRLPGGRIEPRGAIDAVVATPLGPLRVLSTHLGLVPGDRRRQAAFLAALARENRAHPTLLMGDLNEWRLATGPVHGALRAVLPVVAASRTWPANRPFVRMDRFYASAALELRDIRAVAEARGASDHLPLFAELRLVAGPR